MYLVVRLDEDSLDIDVCGYYKDEDKEKAYQEVSKLTNAEQTNKMQHKVLHLDWREADNSFLQMKYEMASSKGKNLRLSSNNTK